MSQAENWLIELTVIIADISASIFLLKMDDFEYRVNLCPCIRHRMTLSRNEL